MSNDRHKYRIPLFDNSGKFIGFEDLDILKGVQPYNAGVCHRGEPEQCAGLTDKNGKLVYEGDVVKTKYFGKDIDHRINVNDYDTFVVKFHECGFYVENDLRRFNMSCRPKLEIIGNIHEDQFRDLAKMLEGDNND